MRSPDERWCAVTPVTSAAARITDTTTSCCVSVSSWKQAKNNRRCGQVSRGGRLRCEPDNLGSRVDKFVGHTGNPDNLFARLGSVGVFVVEQARKICGSDMSRVPVPSGPASAARWIHEEVMRLAAPTRYRDNATSMNAIAHPSPSIQGSRVGRAKAVVTRRGARHAGAGALPEGAAAMSSCQHTEQTAAVCKTPHNDHEYATTRTVHMTTVHPANGLSVVKQLLIDRPSFHLSGEAHWDCTPGTLEGILRSVQDGDSTIETGAGASTVVFAAAGAAHTAISPMCRRTPADQGILRADRCRSQPGQLRGGPVGRCPAGHARP